MAESHPTKEGRCGAVYAPYRCDRARGHTGLHRGYSVQLDEPMFWGDRGIEVALWRCERCGASGELTIDNIDAYAVIDRIENAHDTHAVADGNSCRFSTDIMRVLIVQRQRV